MTQTTPLAPIQVLFLCTHNAARSILAEGLLNHIGAGRFRVFSAGSAPRAQAGPHPLALQTLREAGVATQGLHSKSWDVFAGPAAPAMDLVITVCDNAAGEVCPYWPGQPATAHWGLADPSAVRGDEELRKVAFRETLQAIERRLQGLLALPAGPIAVGELQAVARAAAKR